MGVEFKCENCFLYFRLDARVWWNLDGCSQVRVCTSCFTMHAIRHPKGGPDTIAARNGPVFRNLIDDDGDAFTMYGSDVDWKTEVSLNTEESVQMIGNLPARLNSLDYDKLTCGHCDVSGSLVGRWEINDDGYGACPNCSTERLLLFACYS